MLSLIVVSKLSNFLEILFGTLGGVNRFRSGAEILEKKNTFLIQGQHSFKSIQLTNSSRW